MSTLFWCRCTILEYPIFLSKYSQCCPQFQNFQYVQKIPSLIESEFCKLLQQSPQIISAIPILIACRTSNFQILTDYTRGEFTYKYFNFKHKNPLTQSDSDDILEYTKNTGILDLFKNKTIKSIPDYVLGIEVGLDTNARKNRGGRKM